MTIKEEAQNAGSCSDKGRERAFKSGFIAGANCEAVKALVSNMESISKNSCCNICQEAKLVALSALESWRKANE